MIYNPVIYTRYSWLDLLRLMLREAFDGSSAAARAERERFFLETVDQYGGLISGICRSFANSNAEIDDLRQDVLCNIWKGLQNFENRSQLKTWIHRVALNTCVSTYRKTARAPKHADLEHAADLHSGEVSFESTEWVEKMLKTLSSVDRSIIVMWLDDVSYDEIADVMGMNKNTVATRIRRIRLKLQQLNKEYK